MMMKPPGSSSWPYERGEISSIKSRPCPDVATRKFWQCVAQHSEVLFAPSSSPPAVPMTRAMEAPAMLENGNALQSRRSSACLRAASYALIFVWVIISALVPIVFCLLYHQQVRGSCWAHGSLNESPTENEGDMSWDWKLEHCNGIVQDQGQYLIIQQSGKYFIYAQLFRKERIKQPFTLMLYKDPNITLNNAVGHENGTINFARPFFLQKGDKLYCKKNHNLDHIVLKSQTYWGLFKM